MFPAGKKSAPLPKGSWAMTLKIPAGKKGVKCLDLISPVGRPGKEVEEERKNKEENRIEKQYLRENGSSGRNELAEGQKEKLPRRRNRLFQQHGVSGFKCRGKRWGLPGVFQEREYPAVKFEKEQKAHKRHTLYSALELKRT